MTRSSAYKFRSAELTPSARKEIKVKRERAASPDLSASHARPKKRSRTRGSKLAVEPPSSSASVRHTRAHDATPQPGCFVCYPQGAPRKVKTEPVLIKHTRAHITAPHPDCDVCRLSNSATTVSMPRRTVRPTRLVIPVNVAHSSRVSASPTPSLAQDLLSSEADLGPLTPIPSDDEHIVLETVQKESYDQLSGCTFSSSLAHLRNFLSDAIPTGYSSVGSEQRAYSHLPATRNASRANSTLLPPPQAMDRLPCPTESGPKNSAESMAHPIATPASLQFVPVDIAHQTIVSESGLPSKPPKTMKSLSSSARPVSSTLSGILARASPSRALDVSNGTQPPKIAAVLPPRFKHKLLKPPPTTSDLPSAPTSGPSWCAGTITLTSKTTPAPSITFGQTSFAFAVPGAALLPAQPSVIGDLEAKFGGLRLSTSSDASRPFGAPATISRSTGVQPCTPLVFSALPPLEMEKQASHDIYEISSSSRLKGSCRNIYSTKLEVAAEPPSLPDEPTNPAMPPGQVNTSGVSTSQRHPIRRGLMDRILSGPSHARAKTATKGKTRRTANSQHQRSRAFPSTSTSATPVYASRLVNTEPVLPVLPPVSARIGTVSSGDVTIANSKFSRSPLSASSPALPPYFCLTGPGIPGYAFPSSRVQLQAPVSAPLPSHITRSSRLGKKADAPTLASSVHLTPQDLPIPARPGGGSSSRPNSPEPRRPLRPGAELSTTQDSSSVDTALDTSPLQLLAKDGRRSFGSALSGGVNPIAGAVKVEAETQVFRLPSAASTPNCDGSRTKPLMLTYSSEDEPLIIAVKRRPQAPGVADVGLSAEVPVENNKGAKTTSSKKKRPPRSANKKVKKEDALEADLPIDNKPKGRKNKNDNAGKIKCNIDAVPDGCSSSKAEAQENKKTVKAPRKPRKKAQPKVGGKPQTPPATATELDNEWEAFWSAPSSLFPAPWTTSVQGTADDLRAALESGHASFLPTDGLEHPCDRSTKEVAEPVLMHPPRQFVYDPGSLMAYQGCQWDADGFSAMELSALPWLASTRASGVADGLDAGAEQSNVSPDFSLSLDDSDRNAHIQSLTDLSATAWAPFDMSMKV